MYYVHIFVIYDKMWGEGWGRNFVDDCDKPVVDIG